MVELESSKAALVEEVRLLQEKDVELRHELSRSEQQLLSFQTIQQSSNQSLEHRIQEVEQGGLDNTSKIQKLEASVDTLQTAEIHQVLVQFLFAIRAFLAFIISHFITLHSSIVGLG